MNQNNKVGLFFAVLLGGVHLLWSGLVFFNVAQVICDFVLWAHMIHSSYIIGPFDIAAATTLVVCTTLIGYVLGYVASIIWNKLHA